MAHEKLWSSDVAQTCYFHEKDEVRTGLVGTEITGVMSCYKLDVDNYDNETYRDEPISQAVGGADVEGVFADGDYVTVSDDSTFTKVTVTSTNTASDEAMHFPPRPELKKQTWLEFWSGDGTGSVLYFVKQDKLLSYSVADGPPVFIG